VSFDLFQGELERRDEPLADGAWVLRGFAQHIGAGLIEDIHAVAAHAPFRHLVTPGGFTMSVAMTNCGRLGWCSDRRGYRYDRIDPITGKPWPPMPERFTRLATDAAAHAGYAGFDPDACLVNRYTPGSRLTLHQDRDERDGTQPIVSVSLGVPATFQFAGTERTGPKQRVALVHGDVVVWGGPSRLAFHGVLPLKQASHHLTGEYRFNITFRAARWKAEG
jgi:DNA oxidative demethylase